MTKSSFFSRVFRAYEAFVRAPTNTADFPVSSFPFVSGDTFLQMAGHVFGDTGVVHRRELSHHVCFASGPVATRTDFLERAERFLERQGSGKYTLLIHNGDRIPSDSVLERLGDLFYRVYSVNVTSETSTVRALPIGLENARLNNNGRLSYYLEGLEEPRSNNRPRLIMSSFHVSNNPSVRQPAAELFRASRFGFDGHSWKRKEYRDVLKQTCFVISPPGNGPDCHRTWEAIYMGAVPVVLKEHLGRSLWEGMPILAVDSYHDFVHMSDDVLRNIYAELTNKPATTAFATHWVREFSTWE